MSRGVLLAAGGVDAVQLAYARHRLREDGVVVEVATPSGDPVEPDAGDPVEPTIEPPVAGWDPDLEFVVVPAATGLTAAGATVGPWLAEAAADGAVVAAIGSGVAALADAGLLEDRLATAPARLAEHLEGAGARVTDERVTVDGNLVTARDTEALPFLMMAVRNALAIPQDDDRAVAARPFQERARWDAGG